MPGPLSVLFGAAAGTAPYAPILTSAVATLRETYKIKSHITCNTSIVIYMIQCRLCNLQYIGETKHRLKDRSVTPKPQFQNTFSAIATLFPICYLSQLIYLDMNAIVLGTAPEAHLIHKAKTIEPLGMNKRDEL